MEDKKNIVLKIGLIALIILNLILLYRIYFSDHHPPHHEKLDRPDEFVIRELKLSDEQIQKYQQLIKYHRDSVKKLKEEGRKFRGDFFSQLKSGAMNPKLKNEALTRIIDNQRKIEEVTFDHFSSLRLILNLEQKNRFEQIIDEVLFKLSQKNAPPL